MSDIIGDALIRVKIDTEDARARMREVESGVESKGDSGGEAAPQVNPEGSGDAPRPKPTPRPKPVPAEMDDPGDPRLDAAKTTVTKHAIEVVNRVTGALPGGGGVIDAAQATEGAKSRITDAMKAAREARDRATEAAARAAKTGSAADAVKAANAGKVAALASAAAPVAAGAAIIAAAPSFYRAAPTIEGAVSGLTGIDVGAPTGMGLSFLEMASPIFAIGRGVTRLTQVYGALSDGAAAGGALLSLPSILGKNVSGEGFSEAMSVGIASGRVAWWRQRADEEASRTEERAVGFQVATAVRERAMQALGLGEMTR